MPTAEQESRGGEEPEEEPPPVTAKERRERIAKRADEILRDELGSPSIEPPHVGEDLSNLSMHGSEVLAHSDALGDLFGEMIDDLADVYAQVGDARGIFRDDVGEGMNEVEARASKVLMLKLALRNWIEGNYEGCSSKLAICGIEAIATVQDFLIGERGRGASEPVETLGYCVVGALRKLRDLEES